MTSYTIVPARFPAIQFTGSNQSDLQTFLTANDEFSSLRLLQDSTGNLFLVTAASEAAVYFQAIAINDWLVAARTPNTAQFVPSVFNPPGLAVFWMAPDQFAANFQAVA